MWLRALAYIGWIAFAPCYASEVRTYFGGCWRARKLCLLLLLRVLCRCRARRRYSTNSTSLSSTGEARFPTISATLVAPRSCSGFTCGEPCGSNAFGINGPLELVSLLLSKKVNRLQENILQLIGTLDHPCSYLCDALILLSISLVDPSLNLSLDGCAVLFQQLVTSSP